MVSCGEHLRLGVRSVEGKSSDPGSSSFPLTGMTSLHMAALSMAFLLSSSSFLFRRECSKFLETSSALKAANLPHVVKMSAAGLHLVPPAFNFEAGDDHKTVDSLLKGSGLNCTIYRPLFLRHQCYPFPNLAQSMIMVRSMDRVEMQPLRMWRLETSPNALQSAPCSLQCTPVKRTQSPARLH